MATSPPGSPGLPRPSSAMMKPAQRSSSRLSMNSKVGGSRASDEDGAVRVRPPLKPTDPGYELIPQRFQRSMVQTTSNTGISIDSPQGKKLFVFDRVFSSDVDQEGVWEYLQDSINAFIQGYNVSLLAYGQSGAGKSYTMGTSGPNEQGDLESMGVIPRAAMALFEKLEGPPKSSNRSSMSQLRTPARYSLQTPTPKGEKNWQLKATYVEIYNEQLRDLLVPDHFQQYERSNVTIREDQKGNIILTGLQQIDINSVDDLMNALNFGSTIRQTDATAINAKSSRSHAVFSLNLVQRKSKSQTAQGANKRFSVPIEAMTGTETWVTTDSKLHFVDLAGSERLKNTGAQGERAKEGISINAGLAALGKDSLGGNAITYMIACVTPAEFHLSETLNTVQYAQRARAIQSKPRIQQVEEGDKQAIIERLKAEVAFLRDQIRNAERSGGERRNVATNEKSERQNERESELQDQLLDIQESYNSLSQRHAKLIAEMAKARDNEAAENQDLDDHVGDTATERLNRSNSFAQAVEQVVLEYEKTIQSLEQLLTSTRATLSSTETSLLEKETKCAYVETINTQLQKRLQKLMDREASTESYLHDLEAKLDGHTSGEEKNATIVLELRKEIARIRDNEASCEEYISTLEERLAESDQDQELMQREIDRLEQVIERQRSLGKLDSLLHELDHIQPDGKESDAQSEHGNGIGHRRTMSERSTKSHVSRQSLGRRGTLPEVAEGTEEEANDQDHPDTTSDHEAVGSSIDTPERAPTPTDYPPQSPAQNKYIADKLENVTEELVALRVEHESTINEFDMLHAKYEEALRTLAELQDQVDEARHPNRHRDSILSITSPNETRPQSFLSEMRSSVAKDGTHLSRSLSSELSSAMDSPTTVDIPESEASKPSESRATPVTETASADNSEALTAELERLRALAEEKQAAERELADKYAQLEEMHQETLDMVEELKTEVAKAKYAEPPSPRMGTPVIRRKSSQNVMIIDRAHRSFATLRNMAAEHFEQQPDVMQNFDLNLNSAMHELHVRSERIQELEADVAAARKEMESKMTIISGLTHISMVAALKEQLERNERQLLDMQETHAAPLRISIGEAAEVRSTSTTQTQDVSEQERELRVAHEAKIAHLEAELLSWESKHNAALDALQTTEQQMKKTITDLEAEVAAAYAKIDESRGQAKSDEESEEAETKHQGLVATLRNEIEKFKTIVDGNAAKVAQLEQAHALAKEQLEEVSKARDISSAESRGYQELVSRLEIQIAEHEKALRNHEENLAQLRDNHAREIDEVRASSKEEYDAQIDMLMSEHAENIRFLESDVTEARDELMKIATQVAFALGLEVSVDRISERIEDLIADQKALNVEQQRSVELEGHIDELSAINNTIMRDLETVKSTLNGILHPDSEDLTNPYSSVTEQLAALKKRMHDLENKNKKHSRLVEELEDQLQTNYDQAQLTNNRLSTLQTERNMQLEEANAARIKAQSELETIREEMVGLQARIEELSAADGPKRTDSTSSQVRKTASVISLPSPPPAIPLPPLPPSGATSPTQGIPPASIGGRPTSHDVALAQIREDQEARIQSIERHLKAERQLTSTLEEALTDLESQSKKMKADCEAWKKRAQDLEAEVKELKERPQRENRDSLYQIEEERKKRQDAERARTHLEERMNAINNKKKKKGSLNCF
ncbi:chromosome-associated kinesin KIF4B [Daldinia vernicosa]|uniref:chromosome-associated kinesin KIF4B n=1 Tax=Daldinia vernicosa TaxID=114800 RepID=UPI002008DA67|nr:chromosome-associated kinesin KIF4B [Daldinia vernicosa]KAI0851933.1 chromosome-associated kinesin KIF4B [Daldinia vernicosa]